MKKMTSQVDAISNASHTDTTKKHIRGSSLLVLGRMVSLGLNFVLQIMVVRYLSKTDFGAFAYALSIVSMGSSIMLFGLDKAIMRFVPIYQEQGDHSRMFGTILMTAGTIVGLGLSMIPLVFGLRGLLTRHVVNEPMAIGILLIVIGLAPLQALGNWFQGMFAIFANPRAIFFRRHIMTPGLKLIAVLVVILTRSNVNVLAFSYLIGGLVGAVVSVLMLLQLMRKEGWITHFNLKMIKLPAREVFGFSVPLLSTDLVTILKSTVAVMLLEFFRGATDVAEFRAVVPIAGLNLLVMQSFKFLYTPLAARLFARHDRVGITDLYWRSAIWITIMTFPIFAVSFSFAEPITVLLFGERYAQSGIILALLAFGNYFNAAFGFNSYTLRVYGKVRYIVVIDLLSAVVSLGLNLLLIPRYGAMGAAMGTCSTLVIYNILKHLGLLFGTGIDLFQWRYLTVYFSIVLSTMGLLLVQYTVVPPLYVSVVLVVFASLLLVRFNHRVLDIRSMFPELRRVPLLRPLLGL